MNSLDQIINLKVKITNLLDESVSGTIYAFSSKQRVLALKITSQATGKSPPPPEDSYKIINTAFIKSISVLPPLPKKNQRPNDSLSPEASIDVKKLEASLNEMLENANKNPSKKSSPQPGTTQGPKKSDSGSLASKVFDKLSAKLGKDNVQWQGKDSILLFKEVMISKPYALNKISNARRTQTSKHLEKAKSALREVWLSEDNIERGG
ncbi:hypothetical protein OXX80_003185 [Metschnikowia pulcherrima]